MWSQAENVYLEGDATTGCFQGAKERLWDRSKLFCFSLLNCALETSCSCVAFEVNILGLRPHLRLCVFSGGCRLTLKLPQRSAGEKNVGCRRWFYVWWGGGLWIGTQLENLTFALFVLWEMWAKAYCVSGPNVESCVFSRFFPVLFWKDHPISLSTGSFNHVYVFFCLWRLLSLRLRWL